ncbi:hypothetical protein BG006_010363 [Podila minutissima]|uniref:MICOS complex subunit n=1 Tax=Podila minutissima TaxID=64525 RepID=A0A9P5VIL3_9FUNG|nr:hypothetical protein BG006_010363 [Podila minutissima]
MTIAAATGLVAGGAFSSYTTVYADERQYDERSSRHPDGHHDNRHPSGFDSYEDYKRRFSNKHTLMAQEDELLPGLIYVALAGLGGSLVARQRNIIIRMFSPLAFATAAGAYFLPHTTHSVIDSIGGPMTSTYPTHPIISGHHRLNMSPPSYWSSSSSSSSQSQDNSELVSRARDAWRGAESRANQAGDSVQEHAHRAQNWVDGKVRDAGEAVNDLRGEANRLHKNSSGWFHTHKDEVEDRVEGKVKEAKHWWSTSSKVEDAADMAKDKAQDTGSWFSTKAHEAEKAVEDVAHKAKDWVDDQTAAVERKLDASAKEADEWWKTQAAKEEKKAAEEEEKAAEKKAHERKEAEKAWFHRQRTDKEHPEHSEHSKWWSARYNSAGAIVGAGVGLDAADHHPPTGHKPRKPRGNFLGYASDFGTDGALDDEDVEEHDVANRPSTTRKPTRQFPSDPSLVHHYNHPHHNSFLGYASDFGTDGALDDEDVEEHDVANRPSTTRKPARQFPSDPSLVHHYNHPHHNSFLGYASDFGTDGALDDEDVEEHDLDVVNRPSTTRESTRQFPSDPSLVHHYNHPHHNSFLGYASDFGTDGALDDEDVDKWSSAKEDMGTRDTHLLDHHLSHHHYHDWATGVDEYHPHDKPEYWSNGEEISSSSVRDASYYNYPGSFRNSSLNRASWWSRTSSDHDSHIAELRRRADALAWETKLAEERAAFDLANKLADEQVALERSAAEAKKRAEAAARRAKEQSEALIRERQLAVERAAHEAELRFAAETESAEREASEAKAKALAWELEQLAKAELTAKEVQDRVLHQKRAAEAAAENLKAKADAWAREQKEKAEAEAQEIHERVMRETAAAEKSARDAKAALEAKVRAEKEKLERDALELAERPAKDAKARAEVSVEEKKRATEHSLQVMEDRIATERAEAIARAANEAEQKRVLEQAEAAALEARARADALLSEKRMALERASKENEQIRAFERAEADALVAKARAESLLAEARRSAELSARSVKDELRVSSKRASGAGWNWPWSSQPSTVETTTTTNIRNTHDHERFDSSGQLLEHIAEDIRQTKDDFQGGLGHLKDAVLSAESKAAETVKGAFTAERSSLSSPSAQSHDHHLMDHIREDVRQTKDDVQHGVEHLKDALFGAEKHAADAVDEAKAKVEKTAAEGRGWLSERTKEVERKIAEVDSEARAGLSKAGDKLREMDRELSAEDDDFWLRNEQSRQQQQRRESGRAM